jgi:hypothetical protein
MLDPLGEREQLPEMRLKKGHVRKLEQFGFASKVPRTGSE